MWIFAFKKSILCFGLIFNFWTPSALCHGLCVCVHAWVCECVRAAVILPITLPLHHMFRIRQCWSLLWFLPTPLPLSPCKDCYSVDPPVVPHVVHALRRGQIAVSCVLLPRPGRGRDEKKEQSEPSHMGRRDGYLELPVSFCLFLALLLRWEVYLSSFPFPQRWGSTWWMQRVLKWDHCLWIYLDIKPGPDLSWLQDKAKIWR